MNLLARTLYGLKDSAWGLALQKSPLAHRLFDELARGFFLPLLGVPIDLDVRIALGGRQRAPELKTAHPLKEGEFSLLLIQPPLPDNLRQKRLVPIGIAALAAWVRQEFAGSPVNVGILDAQSQNLSIAEILPLVTAWKWDAVGLSFMSCQAEISRDLARALRANLPGTTLLGGGNHPTAAPESVADVFDYLVLAEGEVTLGEFIRRRLAGQDVSDLPGLAFRGADGKLFRTPERPFEPDLDRFPDMAWDLLPIHAYDWPLHVVGGKRLPVMASRGCPYGCTFCASPGHWRRQVRYRSARRVFEEIQRLQREYKTDYFHFKDDNFGIKTEFVEEFCRLAIDAKLGITWICTDRATHIIRYKKLLPLMREAGCIGIEVGIESADPVAYLEYNKQQELEETEIAIQLQREAGMVPQYTYMAFAPGETIPTYYMQKRLFDRIHADIPFPRFFQPLPFRLYIGQFATSYPNTGFFRDREKLGLSMVDDPNLAHHFNITFLPHSLLEDIPFWTVPRLEARDLELFGIAVWQAFYAQFPGRLPNRRLAMRIWDACQGLTSFFRFCNGTMTLHDVAGRVADELNWSRNKALRICALATNLFSQQGMVRSAIHGQSLEISPQRVPVPGFKRRVIKFLMWRYAPMSLAKLADS